MQWFNEPPEWADHNGLVTVKTAPQTDFWRKTDYGFIRDNGHFFGQPVTGDFIAEAKVTGQYRAQYDQAGLMVRLDEVTWMKCGIEYVDGVQHASVVMTRDFSDWSVVPLPQAPPATWLRVTRRGEALEVQYALDGRTYHLLRLGYFSPADTVQAGIMACSPEGGGFTASFEGFAVRAP